MSIENHYGTLGVHKRNTDDEIKQAYMALAKEFHPDRNPDGAGRMAEINVAYNVLKDKARRAEYDKMLSLLGGTKCSACNGEGATKKQKGFTKVTWRKCEACQGSGTRKREK